MSELFNNNELENISLEELDSLDFTRASIIMDQVDSNTDWDDTSKHITHNGNGMNCP